MRKNRWAVLAVAAGLVGGAACSGTRVRSDDVNGVNADGAHHAIFGAGVRAIDVDGDGVDDTISLLTVKVSDRPNLCAELAADPTLSGVTDIAMAQLFVSRILVDDTAGGFLEGEELTGSPPDVYVDGGIVVVEGGVVKANALGNGGLGSLSLDRYEAGDMLRGSATATINADYTDPLNTVTIDAALEATFSATHCQALSDLMGQ
jgi:hypothetical protein